MLGTSVHSFLEELSRLRATLDWDAARAALPQCEPRIAAQVRASGFDPALASQIAAQALQLALKAANDPQAQWILSPHADAGSEVRWAGVVAGRLTTVRVDRVFRAGLDPLSEGNEAWWVVDYKTAYADNVDAAAAPQPLCAAARSLCPGPAQPAWPGRSPPRRALLSPHDAARLVGSLGLARRICVV